MPTQVRPIRDDELTAYIDAISTGFLDRPDVAGLAEEVRRHWDLSRALAAFEDGRIVGTFRSWAGRLTVPGCSEIQASSVTGVTVSPTDRRRGILGRLAGAEHAAARDRGDVVAILFASEFPIYGRFGYGPATTTATWTVRTPQARLVPLPDDDGRIEIAPTDEATRDRCRIVYDAWRVRQPGEVWRRPITWDTDLGLSTDVWNNRWKGFVALHRDAAGDVDGYVRYHAEAKWADRQPANTLVVDDLHGLSDAVEAALWRFVLGVDWVTVVRAEHRTPDDRLPWLLTNARAASVGDVGDGLWLKLLDVPAALEARHYEASGSLVVELVDADGRNAEGNTVTRSVRVSLDASPEGARVAGTDQSPDLTVASDAVGAAYLGGTRLSRAIVQRGADEHRPGALDLADRLFATFDAPWCSSFF